jgi:hypothetical protein
MGKLSLKKRGMSIFHWCSIGTISIQWRRILHWNFLLMPISTEALKQDLDQLNHSQLQKVADFIDFLKFRDQRRRVVLDPTQLAAMFAEFAEEDRALAEAGMSDYAAMLHQEDHL